MKKLSLTKFFMLLWLCLLAYSQAMATHIVGGEITYKYLGQLGSAATPFRYKIDLTVYVDRNSQFPNGNPETGNIFVGVYTANDCNLYKTLTMTPNPVDVLPEMPPNCDASACLSGVAISVNKMTATVDLAFNMSGYYVYWQRCCRNNSVLNLQNAGGEGSTFVAYIPSAIFPNSSPEFVESGIPFILTGDTTTFANNAIDPDGDRLIYSFVNPYSGGNNGNPSPFGQGAPPVCPTYGTINFNTGYSLTKPFGTGSYAFIDPSTGFTKYYVPNAGRYVVTLEIKEYRKLSDGTDTLLTKTRRELQFIAKTAGVAGCPVNAAPVFKSITNTVPTYTYNIYEGQSVSFTIRATDSATDSLYLSAKSSILDGTNGYTGPLASFTGVKGIGDVSSTFSWQTNCGQTGSFAINATASDRNCPPKTSSAIYTINVLPFDAPPRIFGADTVCTTSPTGTYYVQTTSPDNQFTWKITGGTLLSNIHNDTIKVQWTGSNTNGFLTLVQKSTGGCKDSVSTKVYMRGFQNIVANVPSVNSKKVTICAGQSVGLSATGSTTGYRWSPSTGLSSATSATPTATPSVTTRYIVTVGTGSTVNCWKTDTVTVTVIPKVADAGPATASICSGDSLSVGVTAVSGYTYAWSPTTGVNNTTKSNPKIRVVNTGSSSQVVKYYVTATHTATGCTSRDSIAVTVAPAPVAAAGTDKSICVNGSVQIGGTTQTGATYLWSPSTGLSSSTISNPTVTLSNTGTSPIVQQYILKVTTGSTGACAGFDTVLVTVNPRPVALVGSNQSVCIGTTAVLGGTANPNFSYAWSPKAGLDDSTKANPVFTGSAVGVKTYTLIVKDNATQCVSNAATVNVTVNALPSAAAGADKSICSTGSVQLGSASQTGFSYAWSPSIGLSSTTVSNPTVTLSNTGTSAITQQYILQTTNTATGCIGKDTVLVTVNPLPVAVAGADKTICSNGVVQIGAASQTGFSYLWSPSAGLSDVTAANPTVTLSNTGTSAITQQYILQTTNTATGCIGKDTVLVTVNPLPVAVAGTDKAVCVGSTVVLGGTANPNFSYAWSPKAGLDDSTKANPVFTGSVVGVKIYTLIVKDNATQCVSNVADTVLVTVNPLPVAVAGADKSICSTGSVQLGSASQTGFSYLWSPSVGLSNATAANPTVTLSNTGTSAITQQYILQTTNTATGCIGKDTVLVTVNPLPVAVAGADKTICSNGVVQIGAASQTGFSYAWSPSVGLSDVTAANPTVTLSNTGTSAITQQYILQTTNTATGCIGKDTVLVTVNPLPVSAAGTDKAVCVGSTVVLGGTANPNFSYAWSPKAGLDDSTKANPVFTGSAVGVKTYTLIVKDNTTQCVSNVADTVLVTVNPLPVAVAGADKSICSTGSVQLGSASQTGFSYLWSPSVGLSNATAANPTVTLSNTGTSAITQQYILQITNTATGCIGKDTVLVTVNPLPVAVAGADKTICSNGVVQIGAASQTGFSYAWSPSIGLSSTTVSNPTVTLSNTGTSAITQQYILQTTNTATGCIGKDTVLVTVNPLPVSAAGTDKAACVGSTVVLGGTANPNFSYAWSPKAGLDDSTKANPVFTGSAVGVKTYTLIVKDNTTQCVSNVADTVLVTVNPLPVAVAGADKSICSTGSVQLGSASQTGFSYLWSPSVGLSNATAANPTVTLSNTGTSAITQQYILQTTNTATGCIGKDTVLVTVNPLPVALVGNPQNVCINSTAVLGGTPDANLSYAWSPKVGLDDSTKANPVFTPSAVGAATYTLVVTDNTTNCVSVPVSITLQVKPLPMAVAGVDKVVCSGQNTSLGAAPVAGLTYAWSPKVGLNDSTLANPTFNMTYTGTDSLIKTYILTVTDGFNCPKTDTVNVVVKPLPIVLLGTNDAFCGSDTFELGAPPVAGFSYAWSPSTGLSNANIANPKLTLSNNTQTDQVHDYVLTVTNIKTGCTNKDTLTIRVNPLPIVNLGTNDSLCSGQTITLGAAAVAGFSYAWSPKVGLNDSTLANPTLTLTNPTQAVQTHDYVLTVTNNITGCESKDTITVRVNPLPIVNLGVNDSLCSGETITLGAAAVAGYSYAWSPKVGLNDSTLANPTLTLINATQTVEIHDYVLTVTNNVTGCESKDTLTVRVNPLPLVNLGVNDSLCSGGNIVLGATAAAGYSYAWSPKVGLNDSTLANPTLTLTNPTQAAQTHDYVLTVTNNVTGCVNKDTLTIRVNPLPLVNLGANDSLCSGQTITLGAAAVAGFSYAWSPSIGLSDSALANPTLTILNLTPNVQTQDYVLTVTNNVTGCLNKDTLTVRINPLPIASAGADKGVCSDDNTTVGAAALANVTYTWTTNGQGTLSAANVAMPTYTAANITQQVRVDTLYLLVQAQPTGCVSTDTVLITVNPRPLPQTILYATTWVCPNSDAVYKIVPTDPADTYLWTVVGGSINGANIGTAIQVTWGGANPAAKVYVRATNQYGCAGGLDSVIISINPQLHPVTPAGADTLCSFDAANQTYQTGAFANAASLYTFGVKHPDGSQVSFPSQLGNNQITVNWQGLGIGKVWVRENITTSTTVCEGVSDTLYVLLQPSPDSTLLVNGSSFLCEQTLSSAYHLAGANNGSSFVWAITPSAGATFDGSTNNDSVRVNWLAAGTYVLSVQEISAAGCVGKLIDTTITVNPLPNTQLLTYDTLICPTTLGGRVYAVSGLAGSTYQWTITGGSFAGTDTTSNTAVINWSESASSYALSVVEISAAGCTLTAPLNVPLYADKSSVTLTQVSGSETDATAIELLFAVNNPQTYPQDGKITVQRRQKSGNGSWTSLVELPYTATSYTDFPTAPDTTVYEYRVIGENRCGVELASAVQNNIVLKAWALETERLSQLAWNQYVGWPNGVLRYEIYRKAGETATTFDLYDQKDDGSLAWERKNASDAFTQCYRIKAIAPNGAFSWSNSVCISFENKLVIANVITPNNDGKNDKWVIGNIDLYPDSDVKIFNRWGQQVYKTKGYDNSWDGEDLPAGVYFYEVSSDQKGVKARGWIEILR